MVDSGKWFQGFISNWIVKGDGSYGFVEYEDGSARISRIFYSIAQISPDRLGRTNAARTIGNVVRFQIEPYRRHGEKNLRAINVTAIFSDGDVDVNAHREISTVVSLRRGFVFLRRESGDQLLLHFNNVVPHFQARFGLLRVADKVFHGVKKDDKGRWTAAHAEIFSREEQEEILCGN